MSGRALGLAQTVVGLVTVVAAPRVARQPWSFLGRDAMVGVVRVLGLRQTAQGLATVARPERAVLLGGVAVDALHALSLVPVLATRNPYRQQAAGSAGVAILAVALGLAASSRAPR